VITGFQAELFLWCWAVLVLLHGLYRSFGAAEPDSIRASGPPDNR